MRCNNCGWDTQPNLLRCVKCNALLQGSMVVHNEDSDDRKKEAISGTVKGKDANLPYLDKINVDEKTDIKQKSENIKLCECGYHLHIEAKKCTQCGKVFPANQQQQAPKSKQKEFTGTVNLWANAKHSRCFLKPMARENEKEFNALEFFGEEISLNRENLETNNMTITSKVQASLTNVDGRWYIVDKSSLKTTFKLISEPVELKPGDIILMGDRKFEFDE